MTRRFDPVHLGSPRFSTREHGLYLITDAWFPPRLRLPPHEHDRPVIAVTLEGGWDSVMLRRAHDCTPGTLLIEPAGERHSNQFGNPGGRVLVLQPDVTTSAALETVARSLDRPRAFACPAAAQLACRMRAEIDGPDALSPLALEAYCLELLVLTGRRSCVDRKPPRWLARVVEYLRSHARERITVSEVAAVAGVHSAHLAREFRRHQGTSIGTFVRHLRLAWAAERLAGSAQPLAQIAAEAGFADQSHFTRAFRGYFGRTPRAFREGRSTKA
ncbi:MAG: AraC family transcriptional regulator [Vicinamibacterales bacterium]